MATLIEHNRQVLIQRLKQKGIGSGIIPGLIRELGNLDFVDPHMNLFQVNKRLRYLGWDDVEMDYHTLQLAIACIETACLETGAVN
ncbi:MAG: hypothetical protein JRI75_12150 [Deltaproteobacteria bacterium]|nr:hypothetical protein [Deltaproteobacteria bacterium]